MEIKQTSLNRGERVDYPKRYNVQPPSLFAASDDRTLDHQSLFRWADNGGRWVGEDSIGLWEVRR